MPTQKEIQEIISALENKFHVDCPSGCGEFRLKDAGLFHLENFTPKAEEIHKEMLAEVKERRAELKKEAKNIPMTSEKGAKATNIGFVFERMAPSLDGFKFDHKDCRALFDPIDYVIFEGLNAKGKVGKIILVDVKTGSARLNQRQKKIKELTQSKKLKFKVY